MDGERISLRLEGEDLELIDAFVKKRPEFANRSHLARVALRAFIEQVQSDIPVRANRITIEVPPAVLAQMQGAVDDGMYTGVSAVVEETLRNAWLPQDKREERKRATFERNMKLIERM
ncbi:MAG: ribbon-helix-helix domain-containing protein [Methanomassiliicoccales archaeon]